MNILQKNSSATRKKKEQSSSEVYTDYFSQIVQRFMHKNLSSFALVQLCSRRLLFSRYLTFSYSSNSGKRLGVFDRKAVSYRFCLDLVDTNLHISNKTCCRRTNLFFCGEKKSTDQSQVPVFVSDFCYIFFLFYFTRSLQRTQVNSFT